MSRIMLTVSGFLAFLAVMIAIPNGCEAQALRDRSGPFWFEVLVDGSPVPTFRHRGETYVMGRKGARYTLRIHNDSSQRIEAVASVDGLDVIDGKDANFNKRGYLVQAWSFVDIDGWRLSEANVAAFRFASVANSYAARTGSARNVGVIGVAVFREREYRQDPPVYVPYRSSQEYDNLQGLDDFDTQAEMLPSDPSVGSADRASYGAPQPKPAAKAEKRSASSASATRMREDEMVENRPGLGTEFGEVHNSWVQNVEFERANTKRPDRVLGARYNDRQGLVAMGVIKPRPLNETELRQSARPFASYATPPHDWNWQY